MNIHANGTCTPFRRNCMGWKRADIPERNLASDTACLSAAHLQGGRLANYLLDCEHCMRSGAVRVMLKIHSPSTLHGARATWGLECAIQLGLRQAKGCQAVGVGR